MMLGAILNSEIELRQRVESALDGKQPPQAGENLDNRHMNASAAARRHGRTMLAGSTWIAAALSLIICLAAAVIALHALDVSEARVFQFVDRHRLPLAILIFGSQAILLLTVVVRGGHSQKLEELLSETQGQITHAIGAAEVGLWRWNAKTKLLWLTDRTREILRLAPATLYDPTRIASMIHPEDLPRLRDALLAGGKSGAPFDVEVRLAVKEGEPARWLRCRGRSQTDGQGNITRIDGTVIDISDRIAMQTEIDRQRQSLIHLSRVGTIGKLSNALAHEINQPLTAIMSNAHAIDRMLDQKPINVAEMRNAISDIIEDDTRVNAVITHLRALLKKDSADFGRVDMTFLIHKVIGLVRKELALRRVKPIIAVAPDSPMVWGDEIQLQQLLLNLIMNALEAIESNGNGGGSLTITAYGTHGTGGTYHLCISDTGGGFKPGGAERIFEPYFSTKAQGLGLGLSISAAIVDAHKGAIAAENNNEGGASFHITLPMASQTTS
ncbi:MAG TPA: ATP-binding protein [Rhizomicrobium sp.]|nr:ATP-binding protein [Rhizomicrobium sp.]